VAAIADLELRYVWIQHPDPGFRAEAAIGKRDDELADDDGRRQLMALKRQVIERQRGARAEITLHETDSQVTYDVTAEPLRDPNGSVIGVTTAALDISERKEVQEALQEANARLIQQERLAAVGQLTTGLAHVFNNLFAAMTLRIEVARSRRATGESVNSILTMLKDEVGEAAALVEKLLEFSRKAIMRRQRVDLVALLRETISELREQVSPGVTMILDVEETSVEVDADPARLEEIVHNLILNAQAAVGGAGTLHVKLQVADVDAGCTVCHRHVTGEWVKMTLMDDGVGIPKEILPHIFEPFFTTDAPAHNGLGLSQVLGIVKQYGGHIDVQSIVGAGTMVTVYLPPHGQRKPFSLTPGTDTQMHLGAVREVGDRAAKDK